jgi:hypothetical protein
MACPMDSNGALSWLPRGKYRVYELNDNKDWYINPQDPDTGWMVSKIRQYNLFVCDRFVFSDNLNKLYDGIKSKEHANTYGPRVKDEYDFQCPQCEYHYSALTPFDSTEYGDVFTDEHHMTINCVCKCKFAVNVKYIVTNKITITEL